MAKRQPASKPSADRCQSETRELRPPGLLGLIQDLYAAHKDNRVSSRPVLGFHSDVLAAVQAPRKRQTAGSGRMSCEAFDERIRPAAGAK